MNTLPETATGLITIDLEKIAANWCALARIVEPADCGAVVKADAYGLGATQIIPALVRAGCRTLFVATPDEAAEARALAPTATIYVLDGLMPGTGEALLLHRAVPVLSSIPEIEEWSALCEARGTRLPTVLHVDSGLNRLGLSPAEIETLASRKSLVDTIDIRLIMSHLASADDPKDDKNEEQRRAFDKARARFPGVPASLAASDGLMLGTAYHYDLVRPGYAIYGGQAFRGRSTPVSPAIRVAARILQVRDVAPGQSIGYSATWVAARPSRIAIIAAGYADGIARTLSTTNEHTGASVDVGGKLAPIVGRISMDLITIDVTDISQGADRGNLVELIAPGLTIESMGAYAGTIGYEVLTRLGRRFHRIYLGGDHANG